MARWRSALVRAVADGQREFTRVAIWSSTERPLMPCGACRQALYEFAPELEVIVAGDGVEDVSGVELSQRQTNTVLDVAA